MPPKSINLLLIALEFPPLNLGGAHRPFYFAKNLPKFGVNPVVLTLDVSDHPKATNTKLLDELDKDVKIQLIKYDKKSISDVSLPFLNKFIHFFKTDDFWGRSIKHSVKEKFKEIIETNAIDIAYITIPPFSTPRLFIPLLKKYNIPIILDMRDHYSLWRPAPYTTYFHFLRVHWVEKYYLENADKIIVVSNQMKIDLLETHPSISHTKIDVIPNGISCPIETNVITTKPIQEYKKKYIIGYSGHFYYTPEGQVEIMKSWNERKGLKKLYYTNRIEDWKYRSPYFFFKTLNVLFNTYPYLKYKIEFHLAGEEPAWLLSQVKEFDLSENYKYAGYLNSSEIVSFHNNCDAYLITSVKVIDGKDYCIASKVFSYLENGKPILGFVTEGEQQEMLKSTGLGVIFDADDTDNNAEKLYNFLTHFQEFRYNKTINQKYLRINHADALSKIIFRILNE